MASSTYSLEKSRKNGVVLPLNKRVLLFLLAYCIQLIYVPTSNRISGGIEPRLPIDIFPIWSIWVVPYLLCYALWFAGALWVVLKMEDRLFRAFLIACMVTFSLGSFTFVFFPTYVRQATFHSTDIFTMLLRFIHTHWGRYDAFPSGHVYITTLLTLFFSRWYPRQRVWWISILVLVIFSTLFTGQHYILDVVGGYSFAIIGYHFGLWWAGFYTEQKGSNKRVTSSSLN